jgi:condensin complex subunit 2
VPHALAAKQVDVRALKEIVWAGVEAEAAAKEASGAAADDATANARAPVDFHAVLARVPERSAAGRLEDLSVHMAFICLLHLANERGLAVKGGADLRTLSVFQPR